MSQLPPAKTETDLHLHGDELMKVLQRGWAPMPQHTVMTLVMSGLKVRLTRSIVTMVSIVLAIAFLAYTGLSAKLYSELVQLSAQMRNADELPPAQLRQALAQIAPLQVIPALSRDKQKQLAVQIGMADVKEQVVELGRLEQRKRSVDLEVRGTQQALESARAVADNDAQVAEISQRLEQTSLQQQKLGRQIDALAAQVNMGRWLRGGSVPEADDQMAATLEKQLMARRSELMAQARSIPRFEDPQLVAFAVMVNLSRGDNEHQAAVATLTDAVNTELEKRRGTRVQLMLRQAGINTDPSAGGETMDYWLIAMAMLTCAVGIANAMLMSVTERIREIGTMKCLGAVDGLVVKIFLLESGVLGVVGALLGVVLGLIVAAGAAVLQFGTFGLTGFPIGQSVLIVIYSVIAGMALSVVGAVYPALVAARMNPVDALRVDE